MEISSFFHWFKKYNAKNEPSKTTITKMVIINHLFLSPPINSIEKVIIKYITTAPVSGSIKVNIEGMKTTINTFNIHNSLLTVGFFKN